MDVKSAFIHGDIQEDVYISSRLHITSDTSLHIKQILVWFKTGPKSIVCKDGFFSSIAKLCEMKIRSECVSTVA